MMSKDVDITLVGDKELMQVLNNLPAKVNLKVLKRVVNDSANPMVKEVRANAPVGATQNLKKSIGKKAGKSKRSAVVFVGPRTGGNHKGFIANILEHSKEKIRYPKKSKALSTPWGPRKSVGRLRRRVFVRPSIQRTLKVVEDRFTISLRKILTKEFNKARK